MATSESVKFRERDMDPVMSYFDWPDLAPVADALGGRGVTVRTLRDLEDLKKTIQGRDRPLLVDVKFSRDLHAD